MFETKNFAYLITALMILTACGKTSEPQDFNGNNNYCNNVDSDTDGDGVNDAQECANGTDPFVPNATTGTTPVTEDPPASPVDTPVEDPEYLPGVACDVEDFSQGYTITCPGFDPVSVYHGQDGFDGQDGSDGNDGQDGADGSDGQDGDEGPTGPAGADGVSCSAITDNGVNYIRCTDGTEIVLDNTGCHVTQSSTEVEITCDDGSSALIDLTELTGQVDWQSHYLSVIGSVGEANIYKVSDGDRQYQGHGTGWVIAEDTVVTNWHVAGSLAQAGSDYSSFPEGYHYEICMAFPVEATLNPTIEFDTEICTPLYNNELFGQDIAILQIDTGDRDPLPLCEADYMELEMLTQVMAVGYPLEFNFVASVDQISAFSDTSITGINWTDPSTLIIKHDAKIDGGNSGGPLVMDEGGEVCVVGINFAGAIYMDAHPLALSVDYLKPLDIDTLDFEETPEPNADDYEVVEILYDDDYYINDNDPAEQIEYYEIDATEGRIYIYEPSPNGVDPELTDFYYLLFDPDGYWVDWYWGQDYPQWGFTANQTGTYTLEVWTLYYYDEGNFHFTVTEWSDSDAPVMVDCWPDSDGDGYGDDSAPLEEHEDSCNVGYVEDNTDCDDTDDQVNPGESEVNDGVDNDCDGEIDEGFTGLPVNPDWEDDFRLWEESGLPTDPQSEEYEHATYGTVVRLTELPGVDHWQVHFETILNQEWLDGTTYRVQGKIRATDSGTVNLQVSDVNDDNSGFGVFENIVIFSNETDTWKDFTIEFTATNNAMTRVEFHLGAMTGDVEFADIRFGNID